MPNFTLADVARGLANLRNSLRDDVFPTLQSTIDRPEGGYFIIPREVFAYVDFLGALYCGYDGKADRSGRRIIAAGWKAIRFLEEIFGEVDPIYRNYGRLAHGMFRHGTIHVYRPHALKRPDGATIEWLSYKGKRRNARVSYDGQALSVNHLEPHQHDASAKRYILPLSINTLYEDLVAAITVYESTVKTQHERGDHALLQKYQDTMSALMTPEITELTW